MDCWADLPQELLIEITKWLSLSDVLTLSSVNRYHRSILLEEYIRYSPYVGSKAEYHYWPYNNNSLLYLTELAEKLYATPRVIKTNFDKYFYYSSLLDELDDTVLTVLAWGSKYPELEGISHRKGLKIYRHFVTLRKPNHMFLRVRGYASLTDNDLTIQGVDVLRTSHIGLIKFVLNQDVYDFRGVGDNLIYIISMNKLLAPEELVEILVECFNKRRENILRDTDLLGIVIKSMNRKIHLRRALYSLKRLSYKLGLENVLPHLEYNRMHSLALKWLESRYDISKYWDSKTDIDRVMITR